MPFTWRNTIHVPMHFTWQTKLSNACILHGEISNACILHGELSKAYILCGELSNACVLHGELSNACILHGKICKALIHLHDVRKLDRSWRYTWLRNKSYLKYY